MRKAEITAIIGGVVLGIAWNFPAELPAVVIGWLAAYFLLQAVESEKPFLACYLYGLAFHPFGFYWLVYTISHFGGFPLIAGVFIFALFCAASSLQFILFPLFYRSLPKVFDRLALRAAIAWATCEFLSIKIFPWHLGHTQLAATPLIQIADIAGSISISFAMLWITDLLCQYKRIKLAPLAAGALLGGILTYGYYRLSVQEQVLRNARSINIAMVQGNVSLSDKHNPERSRKNVKRYIELSRPYAKKDTLIIWPETAIMDWVYTGVGMIENSRKLPFFNRGEQWLIGALTFKDRAHLYNSTVAIMSDGTVPEPYHKKILMPFGEYTPFGEALPWLKALNATAADFTPGTRSTPFRYTVNNTPSYVSSLICYEDIVSSIGREVSKNGAQLIVNQTNDAWFGQTIAPIQHHVLAAFRAVENRKFLARVTNTGLTALVDPVGRTTHKIPTFSKGVIETEVKLLDGGTIYNRTVEDKPYWIFTIIICCSILLSIFRFLIDRIRR